jgi:hypothetical protein
MSEPLLKHSRLPRKYTAQGQAVAEKPAIDPANLPKLRDAAPEVILERYLSDESTASIAADYGVTRQGLGRFLLRHAEEEWKEAQVARAIARKEKAEDDLEAAQDPLALAKARELFKAATWDLERVCRRIYGEDHKTESAVTPILNITIANASEEPPRISVSLARVNDQDEGRIIDVQSQQSDEKA